MKKELKNSKRPWLPAILTLLILCFFLFSCVKPQPQIVLVGDARAVQKLPNGNYEITPAALVKIARIQNENNLMKAEIRKLREIIETLKKQ